MVRRRDVLSTVATGGVLGSTLGFSVESVAARLATESEYDGYPERRDDDRVEFIDADPDFGFNYPYWLATPENFRSEPVPVMVEMNNAEKGLDLDSLKDRVWDQITRFELVGPWLSEELGVPQLIPVFPRPAGDPIDSTHETIMLDRETMLLDESDLERIDLQLLRMAEHARSLLSSEHETDENVLFYGNSSGGVVGERMAAMHPESVRAVAAGGLNGFVLLPFETLGDHTLNYPVGVNDFESILGKQYDGDAHADVDMFYFEGEEDPKNRLSMDDRGDPALWNDIEVLRTARAIYGVDKVTDRFPRCNAAFEKAGIDAQFRVYEGMRHDPTPASTDIRDFFQRSIQGEDVSAFGQNLDFNLDWEPEATTQEGTDDGFQVEFGVAGSYPPPHGLVSYEWTFGNGTTASGLPVTTTFGELDTYEVAVAIEAPDGQRSEQSIQYTVEDTVPEIQSTNLSANSVAVNESVTLSVTVVNGGNSAGKIHLPLAVDGTVRDRASTFLDVGESDQILFEFDFDTAGEYEISVIDETVGDITVGSDTAQTDTSAEMSTTTDSTTGGTPGFGVLSVLGGIGSLVGYWKYQDVSEES